MEIADVLRQKLPKEQVLEHESMSKHTTFRIGGPADVFVRVNSIEELQYVMSTVRTCNVPLVILGNGSNVLVRDKGVRGVVCQVCICKFEISQCGSNVAVACGSGCKVPEVAQKLLREGVSGFEFAAGIPGTIGGAVRMNAGAHGKEMQDVVVCSKCMREDGQIVELTLAEHCFGYRKSIFADKKYVILETTLKLKKGIKSDIETTMQQYLDYRKQNQPLDKPSAGSVFKRSDKFITAKLIDEAGLKGTQIGGAQISPKHAGFIVNTGNATAKDVLALVDLIKEEILKKTGETIELEIEVIGEE